MTPSETSVAPGATLPHGATPLRKALLSHYDTHRRALPWREETDPYRVWISEIMLQQTRVETVIPYYRRWLERFPTVEALADASVDDVLLFWEGLGYYRRARNLHRAARMVRDGAEGRIPSSYRELRDLPGVGDYTAGAIASIAFGEAVPAVDGNVRRVLARLFDEAEPTAAWTRRVAEALVDPARPGDFNQALMDLGATICTPRNSECDRCPLEGWCAARAAGTVADRPRRTFARPVPKRDFVAIVVADRRRRVLVERSPEEGLLGGLWTFPVATLEEGQVTESVAQRMAVAELGVRPYGEAPRPLPAVRHRFTHLDATYHPVLIRGGGGASERRRWIPLDGPRDVALPVAQQKIAGAAEAALVSKRRKRGG